MGNVEDTSYTFKDVLLILRGGWLILLLIGLFSFLLSAYIVKTTEPKYEAHTVLELAQESITSNSNNANSALAFFLPATQNQDRNSYLVSRITSDSFLESFLLSDSLPSGFDCSFKYKKVELFSFRGFLSYFNITEFKPPTDRQKRKSEIDCLKSSISFKPYGFKEMKTNAVAIIIEHISVFGQYI